MRKGAARGARRFVAPWIAVIAFLAAACSGARAPAFAHSFDSPEALASEVLDRLARRDLDRLKALGLGEHEFRKWVWPKVPAGRPEVNMPFEYFWRDFSARSHASLASTLAEFGGRRLTLRRVEFGGATTDYGSFSVSRETRLTVADEQGNERRIQAFGSMLESGGRWTLVSYVVD